MAAKNQKIKWQQLKRSIDTSVHAKSCCTIFLGVHCAESCSNPHSRGSSAVIYGQALTVIAVLKSPTLFKLQHVKCHNAAVCDDRLGVVGVLHGEGGAGAGLP